EGMIKLGLLSKFFSNARRPSGIPGKIMIAGMNIFHAPVAEWAMSCLNISDPSNIAELGCGGGKNIKDLLEKYPASKVTGVDYSPLSVEKAKAYNKNMIASGRCEIIEGDVSSLNFEDGKFDLASAFETIYFWPGLVKCFAEVKRILRDGGHFFIASESDGQDAPSLWFRKIIDGMNTYTPDEIEDALRAAGFKNIITRRHEKHSWIAIISEK
ncbi:MAG: class I SAM-dependent methyltransferase, partial [Synergistaceae bacterium]|nr:class I SAM-dependent methyltransferase [Synergistaceae bacterium]